jgi:hypothetical protein
MDQFESFELLIYFDFNPILRNREQARRAVPLRLDINIPSAPLNKEGAMTAPLHSEIVEIAGGFKTRPYIGNYGNHRRVIPIR